MRLVSGNSPFPQGFRDDAEHRAAVELLKSCLQGMNAQRTNRTRHAVRRLRAIEAQPVQPIQPMQVAPSFLSGSRAPVSFPPPEPPRPAVQGAPPRLETFSDRAARCDAGANCSSAGYEASYAVLVDVGQAHAFRRTISPA